LKSFLSKRNFPSERIIARKRNIEARLKRKALKARGSISLRARLTTAKFVPQIMAMNNNKASVVEIMRE